jgi:hypothetical protein
MDETPPSPLIRRMLLSRRLSVVGMIVGYALIYATHSRGAMIFTVSQCALFAFLFMAIPFVKWAQTGFRPNPAMIGFLAVILLVCGYLAVTVFFN